MIAGEKSQLLAAASAQLLYASAGHILEGHTCIYVAVVTIAGTDGSRSNRLAVLMDSSSTGDKGTSSLMGSAECLSELLLEFRLKNGRLLAEPAKGESIMLRLRRGMDVG